MYNRCARLKKYLILYFAEGILLQEEYLILYFAEGILLQEEYLSL